LPKFFKNKKRLEKTLKNVKRDQNKKVKNVFYIYDVSVLL